MSGSIRRPAMRRPVAEIDLMYDSLDEALRETFPASDPIAVGVVRPVRLESARSTSNDHLETDRVPIVVEDWRDLLLRSRASVSLAPRRRPADRLAS